MRPPEPSGRPVNLSIVTVNYRSSDFLRKCLRSVYASDLRIPYEFIVVDNDSWDEKMDALQKDFPEAIFIRLPENRGFPGGNNAGFERARGSVYLLLNPDTEVDPRAIQTLYDKITSGQATGMAGPKIYYPDGTLQTEYVPKKMPTLFDFFMEMFYLDKIFSKIPAFNSYYGANFQYEKEQTLGQLSGACLMVKKEVVERVGGIDEKLFLYFDEADWCRRAEKAGYRMLYVPSASIVHYEGKSAGLNKKRSVELWHNSQLYLMRKHYGRGIALLLYGVNLIGFMLRILTAPIYLLKYGNWGKVKKNLWQIEYHLNPSHLAAIFRS